MNFDKEPKSRIFCWGGGGGGGGGGGEGGGMGGGEYERDSRHIFYTRHIVTTSSIKLHSLVKIFLLVFKIEGSKALTIKGR